MPAGVVEDADHAGGALIGGAGEVELLDQRLIGGQSGDRHREGVRDVSDQSSERHHHLDAEHLGGIGDAIGKGPPAQVGLGAGEQHKVALGARRSGGEQDVARPLDLAALSLGQRDRRPVGLEVEELLGVDLGDHVRIERFRRCGQCGGGGACGVVPARESTDEDRGSKLRRLGLPGERVH